ncbi:hypothetical protein GCM10009838_34120 [Catenulispora subtropica]|uniref:Lipoprotein n=1 Tax=Catenulispora subtropica TaxID=450798 RepID=A0ABP5D1A6_9ACTN
MRAVSRWALLAAVLLVSSAACTVDEFRFASVVNGCGHPIQAFLAEGAPPAGDMAPLVGDADWASLAPEASYLAGYVPGPRDPEELYLWVRTGPGVAPKGSPIPYGPLVKVKGKKYTVVVEVSGDRCP